MNAIIATPGRFFLSRRVAGLFAVFLLLAAAIPAMAVTDLTVFGPQRYERKQGTPTVYTATFERCEPSDLALLRVWNGDEKKSRVTAAEIFVNGREIFAEHEFKQQVDYLESLIDVEEINELRVVLKSGDFKVPAFLKIDVIGKNCDNTPPVITGSQPAAGALLNTSQPLIAVSCRDEPKGSGIDPASVRLTVDGLNVTALADIAPDSVRYSPATGLPEGEHSVVVTVADRAFNPASLSWTFTIDTIAPVAAFSAPPTGLLTNNPLVDIAGSADEPIQTAAINGMPAIVTGKDFGKDGHSLNEGENILIARVTDLAGNVGQGEVRVVLDTVPPAQPKLTPLGPSTNVAETAIMGEAEAFSVVRIFSQFPAATAATLIGVAQADAAGSFSYPGITLTEGTTLFTATATDAAGNESAPSDAVGVLLDTVPPVITVTAPADQGMSEALAIRISGTLNEAAALTIDGAAVSLDGLAFDHPVVLNPGENTFILLATDPAGNTGAASVTVHADNTPPIVTITAPLDGTLTHTAVITVAGTVNEEGCTASLNSQPLLLSSMNFSTSYTLQEGDNILAVRAIDRAGNVGEAAVRVTLDSQPPQLSLAAPAEGIAGRNLELTLDAADPSGLYLLELRAGGPVIWSRTLDGTASATRTVGYTLSPALPPGTPVGLQARALDLAGNQTNAAAQILVTQAAAGPGTLQGEVYDDRRGLRLPGATWTILGRAGEGETTEEGGYFVELPAEDYLVRIGKPGHTVVDRLVSVRSEQNAAALDARLTPMGTGSVKVPVPLTEPLKVTVPLSDGPAIELTLPADALAEEIDLRLTPVSNQGLFGVLPAGWSPLAALDVRALHAVSGEILNAPPVLAEAALLSIPLPEGVEMPLDAVPLLARYDESALQWIAVATADIDTDRRRASAPLGRMGQYALVLSDPDLVAPPPAIIGQPLDAGESAAPDFDNLTAAGRVVPPASPPLKGLIAVGEVVLTPAVGGALLPSGTVVNARINERFDLTSGESVQPADYVQDLVLYRYPCVTNPQRGVAGEMAGEGSLRTTFPVSPSREYGFVDLLLGKVGVEIQLAEEEAADGMMIGAAGARLLTEAGDALEIPAGALARTTPVALRPASAGAAGAIGDDFVLLRALAVDLTGQTLMAPATLSIAVPAGFDPALPVVLARVVEFGGVQRLKLAGFVQKSGSMLVSETTLSASSAPSAVKELILPGVTVSGTYAFLQAKAPIGLVGGKVTAIAGTPFAGARVSAAGATLADLTGGDGRYLLALPLAPFTLRAVDPHMADRGEGSIHLQSAWQLATLDLAIQAVPPRVVALEPADGATGVVPSAALRIVFSEPVERTSVTEQSVVLKDNAGAVIPGVFSFSPDGAAVAFYPSVPLRSETVHTLTVATAVRDLQGYSLAASATSTFTVRKTVPPPMPPAGAITATFPDAGGMITVTATQGSAPADVTVLVINDTTGEIVAVVPQSNGSFNARINAQLGDEIQVVLMDASGNQTIVTYLTFKAPDGRYLVTAKGGKVEGEGGSLLEIPEGALVGPAILKITWVAQEALPHPVPDQFNFVGAFKVDTGGLPFTKEVDLSMPLPADYPADAFPMVVRPNILVNADGSEEKVFEIIDYAKVENGRLTTASYPYPGILEQGIYLFFYPDQLSELGGPVKVSGIAYHDKNGVGGYQPDADAPVKKAVVRSSRAESLIAYANAEGRYACFGWSRSSTNRDFTVTAIHPLTMNRVEIPLSVNAEPYEVKNLNFKLADKDTNFPDTTAPDLKVAINVAPSATGGYNFGFIEAGTPLVFDVIVIDQEIDRVTISGQFAGDDGVRILVPVSVNLSKQDIYTALDKGEGGDSGTAATWKYTFQTIFSGEFNGPGGAFNPSRPGLYTFTVEAVDKAKNATIRTREIQAVAKGEIPGSIAGPPTVVDIHPGDGAYSLPVTSTVSVYFNEPVLNVTPETLRLIDLQSKQPVPAYVYTGIDDGIMRATIQPRSNLYFGRDYQVVVTTAITDRPDGNPPDETGEVKPLPLREERRTTFRTKEPKLYGLPEEQVLNGARDIAFYRFGSNTFAAVAAGANGWQMLDVTDPSRPRMIDSHSLTNAGVTWDVRGVAIDQQSGILAVTENIRFADGAHYGYLRLFNLRKILDKTADAKTPIGKAKLAEAYSGVPTRLAIHNGKAYVATTGAGLQIVDLDAAQKTGPGAGNPIVGAYTSEAEGYGMVLDIVLGSGNQLLLTTQSGQLLILDVNIPQMPRVLSATNLGGSITQAAVALDYRFTVDGSIEHRDVAVVSCRDGNIRTLDISNPTVPVLMGEAVDATGKPLSLTVRDLAISPGSGVAVASTFNTLEIIDIRDPYHPRLLLRLAQYPQNSSRIAALGAIDGVEILNGWLYACSANDGLRIIDLDTVTIVTEPRYIILDTAGRPVDPKNTSQALPALRYTIVPSDYQAATAEVVIYKDGQLIAALPGARQTGGSVDITKTATGAPIAYDPASVYYAQVVLNRSAGMAVEGPRIPFIRQAVLIPDYNRDRKIDDQDRKLAMESKTFYFWVNDDDDERETEGNDIPLVNTYLDGAKRDYFNRKVDGVRDLIDFFPLQLNLRELLTVYPAGQYDYRLSTGGEHFNLVFAKLKAEDAGDFLVDVLTARALGNADTAPIKASGIAINADTSGGTFMSSLEKDGKDVVLLEGRQAFQGQLMVEIVDGSTVLFRSALNLSIDGVEKMFRHLNLIQAINDPDAPDMEPGEIGEHKSKGGEKNRLGVPVNYPDSEADGKENESNPRYVLWVHGFNVNGQQVRGWHSEMFKRFYWAGSKARFVGVSWFGFEKPQPDYHTNVEHAFETASVFGANLKQVTEDKPVTVIAHSLGNMLASSYLSDHHMSMAQESRPNIDKYIMIDAAVALEAYLGDTQNSQEVFDASNPMVHTQWHGYQKRFGASEWCQLFSDKNDERKNLTWRRRFQNLPSGVGYFSFFSTGEEVLATLKGDGPTWEQLKNMDFGRHAWVIQEKWKGRAPYDNWGGTTLIGWGFNPDDYYPYIPWDTNLPRDDYQAKANIKIDSLSLISKPFFRKSASSNPLSVLFDETIGGSGSAYAKDHRDYMLARALPALTLPTGGPDGERMKLRIGPDNIINMDENKNDWPIERTKDNDFNWWHSDIKDVAFPFTYKVVDELLHKGGLYQ